jgi:peptidoglycan hydrolase-like protein with peptidoglycan-binding domain
MGVAIKNSVGRLGENAVEDVIIIQHLLLQHGLAIGRTDGHCGPRTIAGITLFQTAFLRNPDGLVEPNGKTMNRLNLTVRKNLISNIIAPTVTSHQAIEQAVPSEVPVSMTRLVRKSTLGLLNPGLVAVYNLYMTEHLGKPRASYSADCQPITNERLKNYV